MASDDDKNRKAILLRRARFMAAVLGTTTSCDLIAPRPCLEPAMHRPVQPEDGGTDEWA